MEVNETPRPEGLFTIRIHLEIHLELERINQVSIQVHHIQTQIAASPVLATLRATTLQFETLLMF